MRIAPFFRAPARTLARTLPLLLPTLLASGAEAYVGRWHSYIDNSRVYALIVHDGYVFAGTQGGVRRIDPSNLSEREYGNLDGLVDPWITGFASDEAGVLWAVSHGGYVYALARSRDTRWQVRSRSYAAENWRMNERAVVAAGSHLYLGSTKGLAVFDTRNSISQLNLTRFGNDLDPEVYSLLRRDDTLYVGTSAGLYRARIHFANPLSPPPGAGYANIADHNQWEKVPTPPNAYFNHLVIENGVVSGYSPGSIVFPTRPGEVVLRALHGSPLMIGSQVYQDWKTFTSAVNAGGKAFAGGENGLVVSRQPTEATPDAESFPLPPSFIDVNGALRPYPRDTISNIGAGGGRVWGHSPSGLWRPDARNKRLGFVPSPLPYEGELYTRSLRNTKVDQKGYVYVGSWGGGLTRGRDTLLPAGATLVRLIDTLWLNGLVDKLAAPTTIPRPSDPPSLPRDTLIPERDTLVTVYEKWDKHSPGGDCIQEIAPGFPVVHAVGQPRGRNLYFAMFSSPGTAQHQLVHADIETGKITCIDSTLPGSAPHGVEQLADTLVGIAHDRGVNFVVVHEGPDGPEIQSSALWTVNTSSNEAWDLAADRWGRPWVLINDQLAYLDSLDTSTEKRLKPIDNFIGTACKSIESDPAGMLWVGCSNGLFHVKTTPAGEIASVRPYGPNDGLPGLGIFDVSVDITNGNVWVATDRGVVMFESASQPPVRAADFGEVVPYPNPFRPGHRFVVFGGLPANSTLRIHDATGRVVRVLRPRDMLGNEFQWAGDNEQGKRVAPGVYTFTVTAGSKVRRGKVIVAR